MSNRTLVTVAAVAVVLYVLYRHRMAEPATDAGIVPPNALDWAASPAQDAAYWSLMATGLPSVPGEVREGRATVTPGVMTQWLGRIFPGYVNHWTAPRAATNPVEQLSSASPGATILPGPVPPQQPTPQSAVESSSPWLPNAFVLPAPVAAQPWATELTVDDPLAALLVGGGTIDAVQVPA